jgi:hypothetical protein
MNVDIFNGINENLDKLDRATKDAIIELGFSFRDSIESVSVVFKSFDAFSNLVGVVPEKIIQDYRTGKANKFYVDLESLKTNKIRIYTNYKEAGVQLIGYYVDANGYIYETKIYNDTGPTSVVIKRYDSNMNLIDDQETEDITELSEWSGNKEIINIALRNSLNVICIKKETKNQNYLLVRE